MACALIVATDRSSADYAALDGLRKKDVGDGERYLKVKDFIFTYE